MRKIFTLSLFLLSTFLIWGQSEDLLLDTIFVKSARVPTKTYETGRFVTILKQEQLTKQANLSVDDILRYVPGVEVQSRNAFGAQGDITMRGSTFTQVLVLVDGVRYNDPLTGHFNSYIPVPLIEVERIEILRGPAAAVYGPDAVGGVINVITKVFAENELDRDYQNAMLDVAGGADNLLHLNGGYFLSDGRFKFSLTGSRNSSDGQLIEERSFINNGDTTNLDAYRNYFNINNFAATISFPLGNWTLTNRTAYDYRDFSARYFYTSSTFDKSVEEATALWNHLHLRRSSEKTRDQFDFAYKRSTDEFIFNPLFTGNNHTMNFLNFQYNHQHIVNDSWNWNIGAQVDQRKIDSNDRGQHEDWHVGLYFTSLFRFDNNWTMNTSIRADYDENYDLEFSPQLNLAYQKTNWVFRSTIGRGIRAADYTERFVSNNLPGPLSAGRNLGNPNLDAEQSWSGEIGADVFPNRPFSISATGFIRISDRLVDYILTNESMISNNSNLAEGANYFYAQNVEDVTTTGLELVLNWNQSIGDNLKIRSSLGYTFLDTQNEGDIISVYISSHAKHALAFNAILEGKQWDLGLNGLMKVRNGRLATAIDSELEEQYQVWHLRFNYHLSDTFAAIGQIHNVFDEQYQDILGAKMPDRWLMGGVSWKLR